MSLRTILPLLTLLVITPHSSHFTATAAPLSGSPVSGPFLAPDFPDPSLLTLANGTSYAYSTQSPFSAPGVNIPVAVATSADLTSWARLETVDALPRLPAWVAGPPGQNVWSPEVVELVPGTFHLFFSASTAQSPTRHCIGVATSASPAGPFTPTSDTAPLICPLDAGGAIDASSFTDPATGRNYIVYKVDGDALGHGSAAADLCVNSVEPIVPTPIMLQEIVVGPARGGGEVQLVGAPVAILGNDGAADEGTVEAPVLVKADDGAYVLFFSAGCYASPSYRLEYAVAGDWVDGKAVSDVAGPYERRGALMRTGDFGGRLFGPGSADFSTGGNHELLFHAGMVGERALWVGEVVISWWGVWF